MKKILILCAMLTGLFLSSGISASAQEDTRWDLNVSSAWPGYMAYSAVGEGLGQAFGEVLAVIFTFGLYKPGSQYERTESMILPAFAFQAGYQVLPWLQVGGDVFYHYGWKKWYSKEEDAVPAKFRTSNSVALLPGCKFTYFHKGLFHFYSSIHVGVGVNFSRQEEHQPEDGTQEPASDPGIKPRARLALQTTPIGFAVGNNLYGFVDLGLGSEYSGFRAGLGYKF